MKIVKHLSLIAPLLVAAGCTTSQDDRYGRYGSEPTYSGPVASPTYRTTTTTATYPSGGTRISSPPPSTQGAAAASQVLSDNDVSLINQVRQQFNRYGELASAAQNLQITARNGTVNLIGYVPSERERQMIDAVARSTPGVVAVNDQLQVSARPLATYPQTDQTLAGQLQQALSGHPTLSGFSQNVRVSVQNGRVTLLGNVPSEQDRQMIYDVVRNTPGVVSVSDQLQIATLPTGRVSQAGPVYSSSASRNSGDMFNLHVQGLREADRTLAQRILDGLRIDNTFTAPSEPIDITVANGQVMLQGTVPNSEQKRDVVAAIQRAAGASTVYDDLQVVKAP